MRYDQMGLKVLILGNSARAPRGYIGATSDPFVANAAATAAGIIVFLGVATGAVVLMYVLKGGLWALGTAVALGGGFFLWSASKTTTPGVVSTYSPRLIPNQVFRQIPGGILGFMGEGFYQVTDPKGLGLFSGPTMTRPPVQTLAPGSMVRVFAQSENNYVQIDRPAPGFVCLNCAENPGGPWLVRKS